MEKSIKTNKDQYFNAGLIMWLFSLILLIFAEYGSGKKADNGFVIFLLNFCISVLYLIVLGFKSVFGLKWKFWKLQHIYSIPLLQLFMISAFSLNREINIFDESTLWVQIWIIIQAIAWFTHCYVFDQKSKINYLLNFILGFSFIIYVYYAIYLIPLYFFSLPGMIVLGFSVHTYIPLFFVLFTLKYLRLNFQIESRRFYFNIAGILAAIIIGCGFAAQYKISMDNIDQTYISWRKQKITIPDWIYISQRIDKSFMNERVLKTDLVYLNYKWEGLWNTPGLSYSEKLLHDPLMILSQSIFGNILLDEDQKIKVLNSVYDKRHLSQERLWPGFNLKTSSISTKVQILNSQRLTCTESIYEVENKGDKWLRSTEEAIYTFYLPEGSFATTLSLWINGKEETSILTTKAKADSAYKSIVGREVRDPSILKWQEGNRVMVKIFPCTPEAKRKFKIGFVSPLISENSTLHYQSIRFDGPDPGMASENVKIFTDEPNSLTAIPAGFTKKDNHLEAVFNFTDDWKIELQPRRMSTESFYFNGYAYNIEPYQETNQAFKPDQIYLDINDSWDINEFLKIREACKHKNIYVYDSTLIPLNEENSLHYFRKLNRLKFSLFPVFLIKDPSHSLLISKSENKGCTLKEIGDGYFSNEIKAYSLQNHGALHCLNLGRSHSLFLNTLSQLHILNRSDCKIDPLVKFLKSELIPSVNKDTNIIVLPSAGIKIVRSVSDKPESKPGNDLGFRTFAYNKTMEELGPNYFNADFVSESLIADVKKAHVVSPFSSLIVLESQADYKRFDIHRNAGDLENVKLNHSGAVPEPHEWALIILTFISLIYVRNKTKTSLHTK